MSRYGHEYFVERAHAHEEPTALWKELGAAGFLGVHLPEEYGGGGGTLGDLSVVVEAASAAAWLHGEAGTLAGEGLLAEDLGRHLPEACRRARHLPAAGA